MSVVTIKFKLPEDESDLDLALKAPKIIAAVSDYLKWLRDALKYGNLSPDVHAKIDEARQELFENLESRGINIEQL